MRKTSKNVDGNMIAMLWDNFNEHIMRKEWFPQTPEQHVPNEIFHPLKWRVEAAMGAIDMRLYLREQIFGIEL